MAVLVTGGCGLIGSMLTRMLVEKGEKVYVMDIHLRPEKFSGIAGSLTLWQGDLGNFAKVLEAVRESAPRVIFHLGGMLSLPSNADPQSSFATNVAGTYHVLEAARLFKVPKVIFSSTVATYGLDIQSQVINDATIQRPITMYGSTKVFAELLGRFYRTKYGVDFRAVRFPSVIGPGAKTAHISIYNAWAVEKAFYGEPYQIFVEPQMRCPVLYFKDASRALLLLEAAPAESIQTVCYLLAGIQPMISAEELVGEIKKHFPEAPLTFQPDPLAVQYHRKSQGVVYEDQNARKEWGWKTEYSLPKMIADFYGELKAFPERYR
jgi:nucleoside-diphosphate-sugar epimerase